MKHSGNKKAKNIRRGFEKDWNQYSEPLRKLLGPDNFIKHQKVKEVKDKLHSLKIALKEMNEEFTEKI